MRVRSFATLLALTPLLIACGDSVEGTYSGAGTGFLQEITFRSDDKVDVTFMGMTREGTWSRDGKRVTITVNGDTQVLTLADDGCLDGGGLLGRYCKAGKSTASNDGDRTLSGTWEANSDEGKMSLAFKKDGSVRITMAPSGQPSESLDGRYTLAGSRVTISTPNGMPLELTLADDDLEGSFAGTNLRFAKR